GASFNRNMIVVVEVDNISKLQVTCQGSRFGSNPFHQIAVAADSVYLVVEQIEARLIIVRRQVFLGDGKPNAVSKALAKRAGSNVYAGSQSVLRMAGSFTVQLAEIPDIIHR